MHFLIRLTIFGTFAALGVALAISFATQTNSAPSFDPPPKAAEQRAPSLAENEASNEPVKPRQPESLTPARPVVAEEPAPEPPSTGTHLAASPAPPWVAAYQPRVADPFVKVMDALERVQRNQQLTSEAVSRLREDPPAAPRPVVTELPPAAADDLETAAVSSEPVDARIGKPTTEIAVDQDGDRIDIDAQDSDVRYVLKLLSKAGGLNILASPSVSGNVSASLKNVPIESALTAILKSTGFVFRRDDDFVYVGTPEELESMAHVAEPVATRLYRPSYVSAAAELQKLITPLLSAGFGTVTVSSPAEVGITSDSEQAGGDSFSGNDLVMVRDYVTILDQIDLMVADVDVMPAQVAIEATVLSVRLDDQDVFGVDFELLRNKDTIRVVSGTPLNSLATADFTDGLKVGFLDTSLFAFIDALETIGDTSVIASPRVMCLNKQRAEILIGSELGYISTTVTETAATQAVEFLEVGTHLRIRPYIASDGMVRMEVHPELSTGSVRVEEGFTLPDKEVTQVTTNIMCRSGATIVIGGLIREDLSTNSTQIPVLGNLPLVGAAFRQRSENIQRREIIVLLTPRIVGEPEAWRDGAALASQFEERRDVFLDKMSPLGKRHYGEHYTRLATSAYAAGDLDTALRYVNLGIHFDPLNQNAINLRSEILAVAPGLEVGVREHLHRGLAPLARPHRDYSRQGYPWRIESPDHAPAEVVYPLDDGWRAEPPAEVITPAEAHRSIDG